MFAVVVDIKHTHTRTHAHTQMRTSATSTYLRKKKEHVFVSVCKIERNIAQIDSTTCLVAHYVQDNE
jgi:hypothetical protein